MKISLITLLLIGFFSTAQTKTIFEIARNGTVTEAEALYKANPSIINAINEGKSSPLILACYRGNIEVAEFLIKNGADVNYNSVMGTALMAAVVKGNIALSEKLLKNGANINLADQQGVTALIYAVQFQNTALVELFIHANANKDIKTKDGKTAFEFATFTNNEKLINLLK